MNETIQRPWCAAGDLLKAKAISRFYTATALSFAFVLTVTSVAPCAEQIKDPLAALSQETIVDMRAAEASYLETAASDLKKAHAIRVDFVESLRREHGEHHSEVLVQKVRLRQSKSYLMRTALQQEKIRKCLGTLLLATNKYNAGDPQTANELLESIRPLAIDVLGDADVYYADVLCASSILARTLGELDLATRRAKESAMVARKAYGSDSTVYAAALMHLGVFEASAEQFGDAESHLKEAERITSQIAPFSGALSSIMARLSFLSFRRGYISEGKELALKMSQSLPRDWPHPQAAPGEVQTEISHMFLVASDLYQSGYFNECAFMMELVLAEAAAPPKPSAKKALAQHHQAHAEVLNKLGRIDESSEHQKASILYRFEAVSEDRPRRVQK